ncbi:hypothetical protein FLAG1_07776 [Fusarium langsethiae]|uniref:Chromo domain-containing protein n=1 Tax=Fusarium langsethiae TaxID=179993 RepID=A0A0M9ETL1_FUSLA|nr:hypothetical protein FLAG1_07776 [Fusarium langsethiae]GKU04981.1 unnamed protein product [Fusarium langsethiae]GKU20473.1 unnamed protein product [Fusarium langsethiae]
MEKGRCTEVDGVLVNFHFRHPRITSPPSGLLISNGDALRHWYTNRQTGFPCRLFGTANEVANIKNRLDQLVPPTRSIALKYTISRSLGASNSIATYGPRNGGLAYIDEFWVQRKFQDQALQYWAGTANEDTEEPLPDNAAYRQIVTGLDEYHVLKILDHSQQRDKNRQLLIQWCGYSREAATWEKFEKVWDARKAVVRDYYGLHDLTFENQDCDHFRVLSGDEDDLGLENNIDR